MIELTHCPECGAPAEVRWRAELIGTEGRAGILCARLHWTVVPASSLPAVTPAAIPTQRTAGRERTEPAWQPVRRRSPTDPPPRD